MTQKKERRPRVTRDQDGGVDLLEMGGDQLSALERFQIRFVKKSFEHGSFDRTLRWFQRNIGAKWINGSTRNLRQIHGLDRLPKLDPDKSFICVSNHKSFFDMYVITSMLVGGGLPHRILFPVRSRFFYDHPLGFAVNGLMSFFAMYPPVFHDKKRQALNLAGIDEVVRLLRKGGAFVGLHPEGTRQKGGDPYTLLPAQSGVGRIIQRARVQVLPVFINGLTNSIPEQVAVNEMHKGKVIVVFGKPVDFGTMLDEPSSPRLHKKLAEHTIDAITELGHEEREIRAKLPT